MQLKQATDATTKRNLSLTRKLVLGVAGAGTAAIVGSAGIAAAQSGQPVTPMGNGYGGNSANLTTNVNLNVKGNNNFIEVAIRYMFG